MKLVILDRNGFAGRLSDGVDQPAERILVGGPHLRSRQAEAVGDGAE